MGHINPHIRQKLGQQKRVFQTADYYVRGIIDRQDHYVLSEAITIVESEQAEHRKLALEILHGCYNHRASSLRLGVTGSPGVGKSTFINSVTASMAQSGHKVGILTVDPSSTESKGSILGDKTRMDNIVDHPNIFIRPSPSALHLGGLHPYTYEVISLCEAAGMDRILIETVGVGQSEIEVNRYTDATILLVLPGGGDSLQGIKKGIVEQADLLVVHKSDGDALALSEAAAKEYREAIHLARAGQSVSVLRYSSMTEIGKEELLSAINQLPVSLDDRTRQEELWFMERVHRLAKQQMDRQLAKLLTKEHDKEMSIVERLQTMSSDLYIRVEMKKDKE